MFFLLFASLAIWLIGSVGVMAPVVIASYNKVVLTMCNSFAAGVMLSAGFVHLLHDAEVSLRGLSTRINFPVAEFTASLAFILVFYIETLFSQPLDTQGDHHPLLHMRVDRDVECFPPQRPGGYGAVGSSDALSPREGELPLIQGEYEHQHHYPHHHEEAGAAEEEGGGERGHQKHYDRSQGNDKKEPLYQHQHQHHHHHHSNKGLDLHTLAGALCLLAALGFHSVIEGLGLATSSTDGGPTEVGVFLAIIAHKGLAGMTLGSTMMLADVTRTQYLFTALIFSACTPFGVGVGVLISHYYTDSNTLGIMAAVASGTFIHVAAIEIIPSAFKDSSAPQFTKLASLTAGFLAMSAVATVT